MARRFRKLKKREAIRKIRAPNDGADPYFAKSGQQNLAFENRNPMRVGGDLFD